MSVSQDEPSINPRHDLHNPIAEEVARRASRRLRRTPDTAAFRAQLVAELAERDGAFRAAVQRLTDELAERFRDEPEAS